MFLLSVLLMATGHCVQGVTLTQSGSIAVKTGQSFSISCQISITSYCIHWIRQSQGEALEWMGYMCNGGGSATKDSLKNKISFAQNTATNTVFLKGNNFQPEDTAVYYCARGGRSYFDYWGKGTQVTVTSDSPLAPTVFPLAQCGSLTGDMVTLGCIATGFTPLTFRWTDASGKALTDFIQYPAVQSNGKYSGVSQIRVQKEDWNSQNSFQCAVDNSTGAKIARIEHVEFLQSPSLYIMAPSEKELQDNKTASFGCFAIDFSPKTHNIQWIKKLNGKEIPFERISEFSTPLSNGTISNGRTLYRAVSYLQVKDVEWTDVNVEFTCIFDPKSSNSPKQEKTVKYSFLDDSSECSTAGIQIISPSAEDLFLQKEDPKNRKVQLTCKATQKGVKNITWEDNEGNPLTSLRDNDFAKLLIPYEEWKNGAGFKCVAIDNLGDKLEKTYMRENGGTWTCPSVFLLAPVEKPNSEVTLTCYVKDFYPKEVLVMWLVDDELVSHNSADIISFNTTSLIQSGNAYSVYSQLTMKSDLWMKTDQMISCVVYHETIPKATSMLVRTLDRASNKFSLVNFNIKLPSFCQAQ